MPVGRLYRNISSHEYLFIKITGSASVSNIDINSYRINDNDGVHSLHIIITTLLFQVLGG